MSISTVKLAFDHYLPPKGLKPLGDPIIFLHGLFGSKINNRTVSKILARDLQKQVYCLDLRNHGNSPHSPVHTYPALAADVSAFLKEHSIPNCTLIGHSMGAKTAMAVALTEPSLVNKLIPVDNAPISASLSGDFPKYVQGMKEIMRKGVKSQQEAYDILSKYEPNLAVQQFLLSNLKHKHGHYQFRVPVDILGKSLDYLGDFPYHPDKVRFTKPTLFIRGIHSRYIADEAIPVIGQFFPNFQLKDIDSGHWVISEKPTEFVRDVEEFLSEDD